MNGIMAEEEEANVEDVGSVCGKSLIIAQTELVEFIAVKSMSKAVRSSSL